MSEANGLLANEAFPALDQPPFACKQAPTGIIGETTEDAHYFYSVISAISVVKPALPMGWEVQFAERITHAPTKRKGVRFSRNPG